MDIRDVISGKLRGAGPAVLRGGLACLVPWYASAVGIRNWAYNRGWFRAHSISWPVISIGNLTTGGTGKTPMVAWLSNYLQQLGHRPVLLSRGYKSLENAENDEKRLLDQLCPAVPHLQNRNRVNAAATAIQQQLGNVIVLDDGFQHRRLQRTLDIVLIDAVEPWGYGRLLPRGLLREPMSSLRRAGVVVITRSELVAPAKLQELRTTIAHQTSAPVVVSRFIPSGLIDSNGERASLESLRSKPVAAFCGIGNPAAFEQSLIQACGIALKAFRSFPDHHHYSEQDISLLEDWSNEIGACDLLTTRKDLVKLNCRSIGNCRLWALDIDIEFAAGEAQLKSAIQASLATTTG